MPAMNPYFHSLLPDSGSASTNLHPDGHDWFAAAGATTTTSANSMRQAPQQQHHQQHDPSQQQQQDAQQLQGMLMTAAPTPNALPFLKQQQAMSQQPLQLQQQQLPTSLTMQGMQHYQLQQQQQQQQQPGDLLARYQQQQLQQQQQQLFDPSMRADNSSFLVAAMSQQPSYQDMMYMQQQQQQHQQQERRGSDAATQAAAFNMSLGGYTPAASAMGQRQQNPYSMTSLQQQDQLGQQQQMWMNDTPPSMASLHQTSLQELQLQQQQLMSGAGYYMPQQQQLQQFEPQRRRRSSVSSTGSLSPIGPVRRPSLGINNNANVLFGNTDYARFLASASSAAPPPPLPTMVSAHHAEQLQLHDDFMMGGGGMGGSAMGQLLPQLIRKEKKKRAKTFPEKLMQAMMDHADETAVAWLPDGKSFVIVSPDVFVNEVLNSVFKQAKYASFVRKLHRWGFVRLTSGTGTDCFHHPFFNRNRREWAAKITCAPIREGGGNRDSGTTNRLQQPRATEGGTDKMPSLAGVERFIRAKAAAAALAAQSVEMKGKSKSLSPTPEDKMHEGKEGDSPGYPDPIKGGGGGHHGDSFQMSQLEEKGMVVGGAVDPAKGAKALSPSSEVDDESLGIGARTAV